MFVNIFHSTFRHPLRVAMAVVFLSSLIGKGHGVVIVVSTIGVAVFLKVAVRSERRRNQLRFIVTVLCIMSLGEITSLPIGLQLAAYHIYGFSAELNIILCLINACTIIFLLLYMVYHDEGEIFVTSANLYIAHRNAVLSIIGGLVVGAAINLATCAVLSGDNAQYAIKLAESKVGNQYSFAVSALNSTASKGVTLHSATVKAWNNQDIQTIDVTWRK